MLDEKEKRREEFVEGYPIVLADGQAWHFPRPVVEIRPRFQNGRVIASEGITTYGAEMDELRRQAHEAENDADVIQSIFTLGAFLLLKNYWLTDADLESLLIYTMNSEASLEMVNGIIAVSTGQAPKVSSGGSD